MPRSWGERLGTDEPYCPSSLLAFDFPAMGLSGLSPWPQWDSNAWGDQMGTF